MKILKDKFGKDSSKRHAGILMISLGIILLLIVAIMGLFKAIPDPTSTITCGKTFIFTGSGLLGIGVFEGRVNNN
jgi:hypothetical protein